MNTTWTGCSTNDIQNRYGGDFVVCAPASWTRILEFVFLNYASHAVTIKTLPGEKVYSIMLRMFFALLLPFSGILWALEAIYRSGILESDPLRRAARSGALCMVVRDKDWWPPVQQPIFGTLSRTKPGSRRIFSFTRESEDIMSRSDNY
jgi:hypothetical protein